MEEVAVRQVQALSEGRQTDIVIINKVKKELNIFELTCLLETNIEKRHLDKQKSMHTS